MIRLDTFLISLRAVALAFILFGSVHGLPPPAAAETRPQQAPASRIVLDLPDGYEPSVLFSGFTNEHNGSSIVIVEMPEKAFPDLESGMTPEALAQKGIVNARRLKLDRPDPHVYMQAEQSSPAGTYAKFFVVIQQGGITALITANVPKSSVDAGKIGAIEMESLLMSARVVEKAAPMRELFRLGYLGPFKSAGNTLGTARIYTLDGKASLADGTATKPMLIVAPSLDRRPVGDNPEERALQLISGLPGVTGIKIEERQRVTINGLTGVEIVAGARDHDGGAPVTVYHVLLIAPEGGYFRIVGQVPAAERSKFLSELRRIAQTFEIVK